jgi:hypothetical protein
MKKMSPLCGDFPVYFSSQSLPAGALRHSQFSGGFAQVTGVSNNLARGQCREILQAKINSHLTIFGGKIVFNLANKIDPL